MACRNCEQSWFWKKIGRCQRCINQLIVLCLTFWIIWISWGQYHPKEITAIALLFFSVGFHGLLVLHLWVKFVVLPYRQKQRAQKTDAEKRKKP